MLWLGLTHVATSSAYSASRDLPVDISMKILGSPVEVAFFTLALASDCSNFFLWRGFDILCLGIFVSKTFSNSKSSVVDMLSMVLFMRFWKSCWLQLLIRSATPHIRCRRWRSRKDCASNFFHAKMYPRSSRSSETTWLMVLDNILSVGILLNLLFKSNTKKQTKKHIIWNKCVHTKKHFIYIYIWVFTCFSNCASIRGRCLTPWRSLT